MLAYMRSNSLEIRIAGCSCRPQLLLLLFAGIFFKNFYNPVLQARFWGFWELGGGGRGMYPGYALQANSLLLRKLQILVLF